MKGPVFYGGTDTGRQRSHNEDCFRITLDDNVAILADGMGGHNAGEVASELAANTAQFILSQTKGVNVTERLETAIQAAHNSVLEKAAESPRYHGMGTTIVAALLNNQTLHYAHIGDSRLYQWRKNKLTALTNDHSLQQELIRKGVPPEEAAKQVGRNVLTRAIGLEGELNIDHGQVTVQSRDRYLLCSDGLYEMLSDADIADLLLQNTDIRNCCETLIEQANAEGGKDNITVILIDIP